MGPFDRWPTGHGFDYFYGFLAGETSQWEPRLVREPQRDRAAAQREVSPDRGHGGQGGSTWIKRHQAFSPDKPFLMYWAPGAAHGPHHIFPEWADKYKGKFDDGWDKYRERVFARQKQLGWIPADTKLTPRADTMAVVGQHSRSGAPVPAAADGSVRRVRRAHRRAGRQARRRARATRRPRQHHHPLHLGRQRLERRRSEGQRSANCSPRTTSRTPSSSRSRR